ncbi:hypothetical protein P3342_004357 [Pyrenophora teres f. teres]|nr:hypothetical protein P3342_004357 [Pyrenophora teres f. teres]
MMWLGAQIEYGTLLLLYCFRQALLVARDNVDDVEVFGLERLDDLHTGAVDSGEGRPQRLVAALDGKERRMERWQIERASDAHCQRHQIPGQARMQFLQEPQPALRERLRHRPDMLDLRNADGRGVGGSRGCSSQLVQSGIAEEVCHS